MFHIKGTSVGWGSQGMGHTQPSSLAVQWSALAMAAKDFLLGLFHGHDVITVMCWLDILWGHNGQTESWTTDLLHETWDPAPLGPTPVSSLSWFVVLSTFCVWLPNSVIPEAGHYRVM